MLAEEQESVKKASYKEAMRYIANAKEVLVKAGIENGIYIDAKYVRMACGTAYSGVLVALDALAELKKMEVPKGEKRKSIAFYRDILSYNQKLQGYLDAVYKNLHLSGYYDGNLDSAVIKSGFRYAKDLIALIRPAQGAS